jgi:hypothetical protein
MIRLLLLFLFYSGCLSLNGQGSDLFPAERHAELREEIVYTDDRPSEPELPEPDPAVEPMDLEFLRQPLIIIISIVLLTGLGFLIFRLLGDFGYLRRPATEPSPISLEVEAAALDEEAAVAEGVPLSLLERAEAEGEYAIAIRLLYLGVLKELQDRKHIQYRRDYSNRDYLRQLAGNPHRDAFAAVTAAYERFWYGDYPLDRLTYRVHRTAFTTLTQQLGRAATV